MLIAAYFFPRRRRPRPPRLAPRRLRRHPGRGRKHRRLLAAHPLAFTAVSLTVVMLLTSEIVARREPRRPARPALLRPLPGHALHHRPSRALRRAQRRLGGVPRLQRRGAARRRPSRPHPPRRPRAQRAEAAGLFDGSRARSASRPACRAKDGSWHWLRSSSTLRPRRVADLRPRDRRHRAEAGRGRTRGAADRGRGAGPQRRPHRPAEPPRPRRAAAARDGRARRAESPLCLAIVDIDHFKAYNDANGHLAGDELLRECAIAWDAELRGEDTIVRFGGEEFLVVLPDCPLEQAAEIVERLRAATPAGRPARPASPAGTSPRRSTT